MKYALLNYSKGEASGERGARDMHSGVAAELQKLDVTAAIEVRPVFEQGLGGA
jgi:hypothetical protein